MKQANRTKYHILGIFFAFFLGIFSLHANKSESMSEANIQKETIKMSVFQILDEADLHTFKDFDLAERYIKIAYERALSEKDPKFKFETQRSFGFLYENNNLFKRALDAYLDASKTAEAMTVTQQMTILTDIAIVQKKLGNFKIAKEYHTKVIELAKKNNDLEMIEDNYHGLGNLYNIAGDYDQALDFFHQSLSMAEQRNDKVGIIVTLQDMTTVYLQTHNTNKAYDFINRAYNMAIELNDSIRIASVLNSYGTILTSTEKYDEALEKLKYALMLFEAQGSKTDIAKSYISIANVYMKKGNIAETEHYLLKTLSFVDNLYNYDKAHLYQKLGELYLSKGKLALAEKYLLISYEISNKYDFKDINQVVNYNLYKIYRSEKKLNLAIFHLERSENLSDSLFNQDKSKRMAEMQFRFDLEKGEKQIQQFKLRENNITIGAGAILFVLSIGFLLFIVYIRGQNNSTLKHKNLAIAEQNQKLEESNEVLRQFAYASAHDLKEPLRNIGSFVSLIQRRYTDILPNEAQEYMGYVTTGVRRMNNLLEDLLKYSTLITDKLPERELLDLKDIVKEVSQNLQTTIENKHAEIRLGDKLPNVAMNRLHLTQLFQNLISNSIKFVDDKAPLVQINGQQKNGEVLITVQDNGIGIKKEYSGKVFQLFHRLNKNNAQYEGTGIGLTICKNIVEKYNGKIWFESAENCGTTFYITFPDQLAA